MPGTSNDIIIPIKIHEAVRFGCNKFVVVDSIEAGAYFHRIYITIQDGKLYTSKVITIVNGNIMEFGGELFIRGHSLEADLVNGNEIL